MILSVYMAEGAQEAKEASTHQQVNILMVEDDPKYVELLNTVFEAENFRVTSCVNLEEADKILDDNKGAFDIVLTDRSLGPDKSLDEPNTDGYLVAQKAKAGNPNTQVIMLSGRSRDIDSETQQKFGIDKISQKGESVFKLVKEVKDSYEIKRELDSKRVS